LPAGVAPLACWEPSNEPIEDRADFKNRTNGFVGGAGYSCGLEAEALIERDCRSLRIDDDRNTAGSRVKYQSLLQCERQQLAADSVML